MADVVRLPRVLRLSVDAAPLAGPRLVVPGAAPWGDDPVLGWRWAGEAPVCSAACEVKHLLRDAEPVPARDMGLDAERAAFPVWGSEPGRTGVAAAPPDAVERWSEGDRQSKRFLDCQ